MNAQTFLENIDHIVNAPDGVKRLRELILQLGVQGKLVKQRPDEAPAIHCIEHAENPLIEFKPIASSVVPDGWVSAPLGCVIASNTGGGTPSKNNPAYWNGGIPWASVKDIPTRKYIETTIDRISEEGLNDSSSSLIPANRLIVVTRMGLGKLAINKFPLAINQDLRAIQPTQALDLDYAYLLFKSLNFIGKGVTVKGITIKELHALPVKLPPVAEQKRIVTKVDELMALCDKLEAQQQERERRFPLLSRASHARFVESPILNNLKAIFDATETVSPGDLRKTILSLAIRGELVPQDPNDQPASFTLGEIAKEKAILIKEGQIKKDKYIPKITSEEEPFNLPEGWCFVRLAELSKLITKGSSPKWQGVNYSEDPNDVLFITSENVGNFRLNFDKKKYVEKQFNQIEPRSILSKGDFLMNIVGASIGRTAIYNINEIANINQAVCLIRLFSNFLNSQFLLYFFSSEMCIGYMFDKQVENARANLSMGNISKFVIPLPPLAEQDRIVAKVDQLMILVDKLEEQQNRKRRLAEILAQATVAVITGTQIKEEAKMKAPKTELITKLRVENKPRPTDKSPLANLIAKYNGELSAKALWLQSGLAIDAFYQQLKTEMANGWISEPEKAVMKEVEAN